MATQQQVLDAIAENGEYKATLRYYPQRQICLVGLRGVEPARTLEREGKIRLLSMSEEAIKNGVASHYIWGPK